MGRSCEACKDLVYMYEAYLMNISSWTVCLSAMNGLSVMLENYWVRTRYYTYTLVLMPLDDPRVCFFMIWEELWLIRWQCHHTFQASTQQQQLSCFSSVSSMMSVYKAKHSFLLSACSVPVQFFGITTSDHTWWVFPINIRSSEFPGHGLDLYKD